MKNIFSLLIYLCLVCGCASQNSKSISGGGSNATENGGTSHSKSKSDNSAYSDSSLADKNTTVGSIESNEKKYDTLISAMMSKDDTAVEKASSQLLSINVNDVKTLNALAMYHAQKGHYLLAELILNKVLKINDNSPVAYVNLGWISFQKGKKRDGVNFFNKALNMNPDYVIAAANLGSYFAEVKDYSKARIALEDVYKKGTKDISIINNYAISLMAMGENADAVFEQGMQINSSNINFLVNYCIYLVNEKKDFSKAKEIINKINFIGIHSERKEVIKNLEDKINSNYSNKESLKRVVLQSILLGFILSGMILVSPFSYSQETIVGTKNNLDPGQAVKPPKVHTLDFEDELIEGGVQKPDLFYLIQRKNFNFKKLVRLRENFLPEMRETADYIREGRNKN